MTHFLKNKEMSLIVSLPKNSLDYAKAAWENGANAIKVHINANHFASGTKFEDFNSEWESIELILRNSPIPVGIVLGDNQTDIIRDFKYVLQENFSFVSVYYDHATTEILAQDSLFKTVAIRQNISPQDYKSLEEMGIEALELSILDHSDYGEYLTVRDIMMYKTIIKHSNIPTILPTQRKIRVEDIEVLKGIGIRSLMIGVVVTGNDLEVFASQVSKYSYAVHNN